MSPHHFFYDIPVYRLPAKKYYAEMDQYIDTVLFPPDDPFSGALREMERKNQNANVAIRDHLYQSFGGPWQFNETIGFIRLHFFGSQIRGEYFAVKRKRIVRTRNKTLLFQTWKLAPEIDVPIDATSDVIFNAVLEYLSYCRKELKGRHVDSALLEAIGPYVDWRRLFVDSLRRKS